MPKLIAFDKCPYKSNLVFSNLPSGDVQITGVDGNGDALPGQVLTLPSVPFWLVIDSTRIDKNIRTVETLEDVEPNEDLIGAYKTAELIPFDSVKFNPKFTILPNGEIQVTGADGNGTTLPNQTLAVQSPFKPCAIVINTQTLNSRVIYNLNEVEPLEDIAIEVKTIG